MQDFANKRTETGIGGYIFGICSKTVGQLSYYFYFVGIARVGGKCTTFPSIVWVVVR